MTESWGAASLPTTVDNPSDWNDIALIIEKQSSRPPSADLDSLAAFVAESVQLMILADNTHSGDILRTHFSDQVIGQLMQFSGRLEGCSAKSLDLHLIGAPKSEGHPVVRFRVEITLSEPSQELSRREQFWDIELGVSNVVTGASECASCGAPLAPGALVCPYCRANTAVVGQAPLLVVKLQRIS